MGEKRMMARRHLWFSFGVVPLLVSAIVTGCEYPGVPRAEAAEPQAVVMQPAAGVQSAAAIRLAAAGPLIIVPESAVVPRPAVHEQMQLAEEEGSSPGADKIKKLTLVTADSVPMTDGVVKVEQKDFSLEPDTMKVKAGDVKFHIVNSSTHAHNFRIAEWDNHDNVVSPGPKVGATREREETVQLKPGTYYYFCGLSDHQKRGMVGKLFVQ